MTTQQVGRLSEIVQHVFLIRRDMEEIKRSLTSTPAPKKEDRDEPPLERRAG